MTVTITNWWWLLPLYYLWGAVFFIIAYNNIVKILIKLKVKPISTQAYLTFDDALDSFIVGFWPFSTVLIIFVSIFYVANIFIGLINNLFKAIGGITSDVR